MANPPTYEELIDLALQGKPAPDNWTDALDQYDIPLAERLLIESSQPKDTRAPAPLRTIRPGGFFGNVMGLEEPPPPPQELMEQPAEQPVPRDIQNAYDLFQGAPSTGAGQAPAVFTPIEEEEDPWGGALATIPRGIAKGVGQTAISMGEGLLAMADVVTGSNIEGIDPDTSRAFEILQEAREFVGNEEGVVGKLSEAVGSMFLFAIPGLGQAGMAGRAATLAASGPAALKAAQQARNFARGLGALKWSAAGSAGAGESSQMMAAFKEAGGDYTQGQRNLSIATGGLIGLTELVPIESVLRGFPKGNSPSWIVNKMTSAFVNGGMEGLQEAGAQVLQRINATHIGGYNPDMDWFDSSLSEDFGYGAGAGAIFDLLLSGKGSRLRGGPRPTAEQVQAGYEGTKLPPVASEEELQKVENLTLYDKNGNPQQGTFEGIEGDNARVRINSTGESISVPRDPQDGVGDQGFSLFGNENIYTPKYRIGTVDENNQPSGSVEIGTLSDQEVNNLLVQKEKDWRLTDNPTSQQESDYTALAIENNRRGIYREGTDQEGRVDEPTPVENNSETAPVKAEDQRVYDEELDGKLKTGVDAILTDAETAETQPSVAQRVDTRPAEIEGLTAEELAQIDRRAEDTKLGYDAEDMGATVRREFGDEAGDRFDNRIKERTDELVKQRQAEESQQTSLVPTVKYRKEGVSREINAPDIYSDIAYRRGRTRGTKNPSQQEQNAAKNYNLDIKEFETLSRSYAAQNNKEVEQDNQRLKEEGTPPADWDGFELGSFGDFVNDHAAGKRIYDVDQALANSSLNKKDLKPLIKEVTGNPSSSVIGMTGDQRAQLIEKIGNESVARNKQKKSPLFNVDFIKADKTLRVTDNAGVTVKTVPVEEMGATLQLDRLKDQYNLTEESFDTARNGIRGFSPLAQRLPDDLGQERITIPDTNQELVFASEVDKALHEVAAPPKGKANTPEGKEQRTRDKKYINFLQRHFLQNNGKKPTVKELRAKGKQIKNELINPVLEASPESQVINVPLSETIQVTSPITVDQLKEFRSRAAELGIAPNFIDMGMESWRQRPDVDIDTMVAETFRHYLEKGPRESGEIVTPRSSIENIAAEFKKRGYSPAVWADWYTRTGRSLLPMEGSQGTILEPMLGDPTDVDIAIATSINNIIKKAAPNADGRIANSLFDQNGIPVMGRQIGNIVAVSTAESEYADPQNAAFHEATHYLLREGFFTEEQQNYIDLPETRAKLRSVVQELLGEDGYSLAFKDIEPGTETDIQELLAYTSGYYNSAMERNGKPPDVLTKELDKGPLRRILDSIYNLFKRIGRFINGTDKDSLTAELELLTPSELAAQEAKIKSLLDMVRKGEIGTQEPIGRIDPSGTADDSPLPMIHMGKAAAKQYNYRLKSELTSFLEDKKTQNSAKGSEWLDTLGKKDNNGIPIKSGLLAGAVSRGDFKMAELLNSQLPDFLSRNFDEKITKKQLLEELKKESHLVEIHVAGYTEDARLSSTDQIALSMAEDQLRENYIQYGRYFSKIYPFRTLMSVLSSEQIKSGEPNKLPEDIKPIYEKWEGLRKENKELFDEFFDNREIIDGEPNPRFLGRTSDGDSVFYELDNDPRFEELKNEALSDLQDFVLKRQIGQRINSEDVFAEIAEDGFKENAILSDFGLMPRSIGDIKEISDLWEALATRAGTSPLEDRNITNYQDEIKQAQRRIFGLRNPEEFQGDPRSRVLPIAQKGPAPVAGEGFLDISPPFIDYTVWGKRRVSEDFYDSWDQYKVGPESARMIVISSPVDVPSDLYKGKTIPNYYAEGHTGNIKNPIVHIRVSDILTEDGKKILVVEEVQSDIHQGAGAQIRDIAAESMYGRGNTWSRLNRTQKNEVRKNLAKHEDRVYGKDGSYPNLPFKKQSEWINLGLSHAVRIAVDGGYDGITVANSNFQKERYWENFKDHISGLSITRLQNAEDGYQVQYSVPTDIGPIRKDRPKRFDQRKFNNWIGEDVANLVLYKQEQAQFENDQETLEIPNIIEFINETTQEVLDLEKRLMSKETVDTETLNLFNKYFSETSRRNLSNARKPDGSIDIPVGISGFVQMYDHQIPNQLRENLTRTFSNREKKDYKKNKQVVWFGEGPTGARIVSPDEMADLPNIETFFEETLEQQPLTDEEILARQIAEESGMYEVGDIDPLDLPPEQVSRGRQIVSAANNSSTYFPITSDMTDRKGGESGTDVVAYSMAALGRSGARERKRLFDNTRSKITNWLDSSVAQPLKGLHDREKYLLERGKFLGTIHRVEEFALRLRNDLAPYLDKRNPKKRADSENLRKALVSYMTTSPADGEASRLEVLQAIDKNVAKSAVRAKNVIEDIGKELVSRGLLRPDTFESNKRSYMPQMYLKHILADPSGKSLSYLQEQKIPVDDVTTRNLLGDLTELAPEFVVGRHIQRSMRDIALMEFFDSISKGKNWALKDDKLMVKWIDPNTGKQMEDSVFWMHRAAQDFENNAKYFQDGDQKKAQEMIATAQMLREAYIPVLQQYAKELGLGAVLDSNQNVDPKKLDAIDPGGLEILAGGQSFKRVPNHPKYGKLAGMAVHSTIYDDVITGVSYTGWGDNSYTKLGKAARKATAIWKGIKVPLNPPTVARNTFSNMILMHLSGVPMHRILPNMAKSVREIIAYKNAVKNKNKMSEQEFAEAMEKSKHYKAMLDRGVAEASFTESELYRFVEDIEQMLNEVTIEDAGILNWLNIKTFRKIMKKSGQWYQNIEVMGKTAIALDMMEHQQSTADEAFLKAQKYLFDYSLVPPFVRGTRTSPIGIPFLTFYYKVAPVLLDTAINRPFKFAPYVGMMLGLEAVFKNMFDIDDEEYETMLNLLPDFAKNPGATFPLPIRDSNGRVQLIDLGFIFPWGAFTDLSYQAIKGVKQLAPGPQKEGINGKDIISTIGLFGGPLWALHGPLTNIDPFTLQPIRKEGEPLWIGGAKEELFQGRGQVTDTILYLANQYMLPGFLHTDYGATKRLIDASSGQRSSRGGEGNTVTQAALKFAGLNLYSIDPQTASNVVYYAQQELQKTTTARNRMLQDRSMSREERRRRLLSFDKEIELQMQVLEELIQSVTPSPNLYRALLSDEQRERQK